MAGQALQVETLADDLKAELAHNIHQGLSALSDHVDSAVRSALGDSGPVRNQMLQVVQRAAQRVGDKLRAEVDLYVMRLRRKPSEENREGQHIYNIHGPLGAIVSGPQASAHVMQIVNSEDREVLVRALETVGTQLAALDDAAYPGKSDVLELVYEAREEVERPQPNRFKVHGALVGIGHAIQTIAAIRPAYDALKAAAGVLGVELP